MKLTDSQIRKLRHIAKTGETRNPGDLNTTYSLVVRGLVEAVKHGTFPHAHMTYRISTVGKTVLSDLDRFFRGAGGA